MTAALIWYDESPADLEACVRGMASVADRVIAVDGAYRRYPGAKVSSPPAQAKRIRDVAREVGLECHVIVPNELWAGQVAKRAYVLAAAAKGSDWVAIFDTDWVAVGDRVATRVELQTFGPGVDVVTVPFYTPHGATYSTGWHKENDGIKVNVPHFFRALPELTCETLHWWYSAVKGGRKVWLWHGGDPNREVLPQFPLRSWYEIEHRTLLRDERHILDGRAFCNDRVMVVAKTGQEDDVPGLPAPVFDYVTVPY